MMILIIDANILIAELLRQRGRELLRNRQLSIYAANKVLEETNYEIQKRIIHMVTTGKLSREAGADLTQAAFQLLETCIINVPQVERTSKAVDSLTTRWGRFVEELVRPAVVRMFRDITQEFPLMNILSGKQGKKLVMNY